MKKSFIFYICVVATMMFVSCAKQEGPVGETPEDMSYDLETVTATILKTKTTTEDGVNVLWEDGDAIRLRYYLDGATNATACRFATTLDNPNATATFVKDENEKNSPTLYNGEYVAVYPAELNYSGWSKANFIVKLAPEKEQVVNGDGWDPNSALMYSTSENSDFTFKHVVSYIKFNVDKNTTPFNKILVSSLDESQEIVSRIQINNDKTYQFEKGKSQCSKTVSFSFEGNADFAPGTYYIAINPDTYAQGLQFTFENKGGKSIIKTVSEAAELIPGDYINLGTIGTLPFPDGLDLKSVYTENGVKQGVVFWVDPENPKKGLIVSLTAKTTNWAYLDKLVGSDSDSSLENHNYVTSLSDYNENNYPAVGFCDKMRTELGGNWRLPSIQELAYFASTYYGTTVTATESKDFTQDDAALACTEAFDEIITSAGGDKFTGVTTGYYYWTGKEKKDKGKVCAPRFGSYAPAMSQPHTTTTTGIARCVRDVEIQ